MVDLVKLRELAQAATPGPWVYDAGDGRKNQRMNLMEEVVSEYDQSRPLVTLLATAWKPERHKCAVANATFIAAANPAAVLELIAEIERLREALKPFAQLKPVSWSLEADMHYIDTDDIHRAARALGEKE